MQKGCQPTRQDKLEELTDSREMDASAIIDYFAPVMDWLEKDNEGWQSGV